ncbi:hypothetical protein MO973_07725 [Paenibacillus sp. TRM 82003]|nr:hypothetical protein [Paenibacillus sp. TRM 82003]
MTESDRKVREQFQEEANEMLFGKMDMSESAKQKVRQQVAAEKKERRRFAMPKAWMMGTAAAAVAAVAIFAGIPGLQQPSAPAPIENPSGGVTPGSELSQLTTTKLATIAEAKAAFGDAVRLPIDAPAGFTLSEIAAVGIEGEPVRDIMVSYLSGDKPLTFTATRLEAAFPKEMFTKTEVGGAEAFVFEQPGLVELFWTVDGVNYSIGGAMTTEEAIAFAESAQ